MLSVECLKLDVALAGVHGEWRGCAYVGGSGGGSDCVGICCVGFVGSGG